MHKPLTKLRTHHPKGRTRKDKVPRRPRKCYKRKTKPTPFPSSSNHHLRAIACDHLGPFSFQGDQDKLSNVPPRSSSQCQRTVRRGPLRPKGPIFQEPFHQGKTTSKLRNFPRSPSGVRRLPYERLLLALGFLVRRHFRFLRRVLQFRAMDGRRPRRFPSNDLRESHEGVHSAIRVFFFGKVRRLYVPRRDTPRFLQTSIRVR